MLHRAQTTRGLTRLLSFCLLLALCCALSPALADGSELADTVLDTCRRLGIRSRLFPDDITNDQLILESFAIDFQGQPIQKWLVSTTVQREDVAFGWLEYQTPGDFIITDGRDRASYEIAKWKNGLEVERGLDYFWSPEEKAQYFAAVYGPEASIVAPDESVIDRQTAVALACHALSDAAGST